MLLIKFPLIIIIVPTNRAIVEPFDKTNAGSPHKYKLSAFLSVIQTLPKGSTIKSKMLILCGIPPQLFHLMLLFSYSFQKL